MGTVLDPFSFVVVSMAGWMNRHQQQIIEYLIEENRVLREQVGSRRMRFTDDQRRRLARKAKELGRKLLAQVATIVTPETLAKKVLEVQKAEAAELLVNRQQTGNGANSATAPRPSLRQVLCFL